MMFRGDHLPSLKSDLPRQSPCPIAPQQPAGFGHLDRVRTRSRFSLNGALLVINLGLIIAISSVLIYCRWGDLSNGDLRAYAFGAIDFISHPKLYDRVYLDKPPLAFLMYSPIAFFPAIAGQGIYFAMVIAVEALLLRWLLLELGFDEAACLGGVAFFLIGTLFKNELDYTSLSHLTNLLILGACIAAIKGATRGVIISGVFIAASFYIRQNNVIFALYPLILGRFSNLRLLAIYAISMLASFLALLGLFCLISNVNVLLYTIFVYPFKYANLEIEGQEALGETALFFGIHWLKPLALFLGLWCVSIFTRSRRSINGVQLLLLFGVGLIVVIAPKKAYYQYQGYLLIWLGLLGAWSVDILVTPLFRRRQGWLVSLAAGCAAVLVVTVAWKEIALSGELAAAKSRLDRVLPEIQKALASRPGHPTLQVFDAIYSFHESYDGLLLQLTGAVPATPLIFTLYFGDRVAPALPATLRDQWGLLERNPPDVMVLKDVRDDGDLNGRGPNFAKSLDQFMARTGYHTRALTERVVLAERP